MSTNSPPPALMRNRRRRWSYAACVLKRAVGMEYFTLPETGNDPVGGKPSSGRNTVGASVSYSVPSNRDSIDVQVVIDVLAWFVNIIGERDADLISGDQAACRVREVLSIRANALVSRDCVSIDSQLKVFSAVKSIRSHRDR